MQKNRLTRNHLIKTGLIFIIFTLAIFQQKADAQQMFVDDAEVTTYRSLQIETWYGSRESWFLTAISPVRGLELGTGFGFDSRDGFDPANWVLEAKFVATDLEEVFAYIPYSQMIFNNSSILHINAGFEAVQEEEWEYEMITGIRRDFGITDRFALLGEVAAANFSDAFYQGGGSNFPGPGPA